MIARRVLLSGRVQGVGFRFFAERAAREAGVTGWVRNLPDGGVESVAEGDDLAVQTYLQRVRQGPPGSRVTATQVFEIELGRYRSFEITR